MMDNASSTLNLRDIHLPDDPSMWPLAIGWWLVIVLIVVMIYFFLKKISQLRKQKQLINLMQKELNVINLAFKKHKNNHQLACEISELLKRFVRHILKDNQAASLSGNAWIGYLNKQSNSEIFTPFISELTQAQYQPHCEFDASRLIATVRIFFPTVIKSNLKIIQGVSHD